MTSLNIIDLTGCRQDHLSPTSSFNIGASFGEDFLEEIGSNPLHLPDNINDFGAHICRLDLVSVNIFLIWLRLKFGLQSVNVFIKFGMPLKNFLFVYSLQCVITALKGLRHY